MINNRKRTIILLSWIAVLLWMLFIFNLSSQTADQSDQLSKGIVAVIVEMIEKVAHGFDLDTSGFNHFMRKFAHFFAYLVLGVLVMNALSQSGVRGLRACTFAIGICVLYAVSDEVHQLFVPGRGGQAVDVLLDSVGASVGIGWQRLFRLKEYSIWSKL